MASRLSDGVQRRAHLSWRRTQVSLLRTHVVSTTRLLPSIARYRDVKDRRIRKIARATGLSEAESSDEMSQFGFHH